MTNPRKDPGIEVRTTSKGEKRYRAEAWDRSVGKRVFKTFPTKAAAKSWRSSVQVKIANGEAGVMDSPTLREAYVAWEAKARAGAIRNNRGELYKPSVLRGYEQAMRCHNLPRLGNRKLTEIRLVHVQDHVEKMVASGMAASTVRNTIAPMGVVFVDAIRREQARVNPCAGLKLPSGETVRDRIASPAEAATLLAALPQDRALWATAFYAGLRAGELMALRWSDIDLTSQVIHIGRSYDPKSRVFVTPKTARGVREVPFPLALRPHLAAEHLLAPPVTQPDGDLVFGRDPDTPWLNTTTRNRALRAWTAAGLAPITLHECRHTYASLMLASGVDIVKVSKWMGHSSIQITVDRYGHLVPGDETAAMERFESYLAGGTA